MSREIKFRAWVKSRDSMVDVIAIEQTPDEEYPHGWIACPWEQGFDESIDTQEKDCVFKTEDVVLMQYTGIKDKNGREIYEGDIVNAVAIEEDRDQDRISDVIFGSDLQWQIRAGKQYSHGLPITWGGWKSLEVIGSIYENPELLKESKK